MLKGNFQKEKNMIHMSFLAKGENVSVVRLAIAVAASNTTLTLSGIEEIKLALSEAVSNAVIHGYSEDGAGIVEVVYREYEDRLIIEVSDCGVGIADIAKAVEPEYSTADRMGLGFAFMHSFMDEMEVISEPGSGTSVILTKRLPEKEV